MQRRNAVIYLILLFLFAKPGIAGIKPDPAIMVRDQAERMASALLRSDYITFSKYVHPVVMNEMGGEAEMILTMKEGAKAMQEQGCAFLSAIIGQPSTIIDTAGELQCTLPETIEMKVPEGRLISQSTLVAFSKDSGQTWLFIDTNTKSEGIKALLKNLNSKLVIPENQKPVFLKH